MYVTFTITAKNKILKNRKFHNYYTIIIFFYTDVVEIGRFRSAFEFKIQN